MDLRQADPATEIHFHREVKDHLGIGIYAELYTVGRPVTAHAHDFYEVAFALTGSGQHEDETGVLPILSGDAWVIRPGQWHAYPLVGAGLHVFNLLLLPEFVVSCASLLQVTSLLPRAAEGAEHGAASRDVRQPSQHVRLSARGLEHIRPLLHTLALELRAPDVQGKKTICAGLVLQVLGLLERCGAPATHESPGVLAARGDTGLLAAVRHIDAGYAETITLADLARQSGYAPTYLGHKFRQQLGIAPMDYLFQVRLQHACALLQTTDKPVTTIAHDVGFADSRYFATRFQRSMGVTPSRFRLRRRDQ
jgi:AraC-like DNA-binding protein